MKHLLICFPFLFLLGLKSEKSNVKQFHLSRLTFDYTGLSLTKKPFIEFRSTTIFFDTIKAGNTIKGEFIFKNTGDEPLIITTVQASDGGTFAEWPKEPIDPGAEASIIVRLYTQERQGTQDKLFNVISNAENGQVMLHWKGFVIANRQ